MKTLFLGGLVGGGGFIEAKLLWVRGKFRMEGFVYTPTWRVGRKYMEVEEAVVYERVGGGYFITCDKEKCGR